MMSEAERKKSAVRAALRWQAKNRDRAYAYSKAWRDRNLASVLKQRREHYAANKERLRKKSLEYQAAHPDVVKRLGARKRAAKLRASPKWASKSAIDKIYKDCPPGHQVDHIYPLKSDWVCGLHVPENLQYLPASENISKGNRYYEKYHG